MEHKFQRLILDRMLQVQELFRQFLERERQRGDVDIATSDIIPEMVFSRLSMAAMYFYKPWDKGVGEDRIMEDKRIFMENLAEFLCERLGVQDAG